MENCKKEIIEEVGKQMEELEEKYREQEEKHKELEVKHKELVEKNREVVEKNREVVDKNKDLEEKSKEQTEKYKGLLEKHREVEEKNNNLVEKNKELGKIDIEKQKELVEKNKEVVKKCKELVKRDKELEEKNEDLEKKNKELLESKGMVQKHNALVRELKGKVECPVCLAVPTEGSMASCPKGHLVCLPCHRTMVTQGLMNCPSCREVMGNNMSLLAKTVLENIEHECTNEGCEKKLSHKEVVKHREELCEYRKVLCPGNSKLCKVILPFCALNEHLNICTSVFRGFRGSSVFLTNRGSRGTCFNKLFLDRDQLIFSANIFNLNNEVYAIQTRMDHKNLSFGVLMLADREKCERFKVTLEIQDSNFQTGFLAQINPAPVDTKNSDVTSLVVPKQNLQKWSQLMEIQ